MKITTQSLQFTLVLALVTTISQPAIAQYQSAIDQSSDRYVNCVRNIAIDSDSAFQEANRWRRQGGGPSAEHCEALALVEIAAFDAAAPMLVKLANNETVGSQKMRASLFGQAGNTWILAGQLDQALQAFDSGIALMPENHWMVAEFHIDRGHAFMAATRWGEAEADITKALDILPEHLDALVARATCRRELNDPVGALADLDAALAIDPASPDVFVERGFLRKQMHDLKGAKRDFEHALELTPEGHAAALAMNGLAKLAAHDID